MYLAGNRISDVTEDPYIEVGVETAAFDFLMAHDSALQELAVTKDTEAGEAVSRYFDLPEKPEAVAERFEIFSMLRHLVASDFSGWHEVCTIHAEGSIASQKMMLMAEAPTEIDKSYAREVVGLSS